jgi:DNA-binding NarL/FixJ family response regulator
MAKWLAGRDTAEEINRQSHSMQLLRTYIVEDSAVIRESLVATLEELASIVVVDSADDESTAVQWLSDSGNDADLVIVDLFLKGGSGLGVLRAVQDLPQQRRMVVLTNYATEAIRKKCLGLGADRVFDKSGEIDALIRYCNEITAGMDEYSGSNRA